MKMTRHDLSGALLVFLPLMACHDPLPCPGCDEAADDTDEAEPLPDLPCGGADLMTDNDNCGSCGNQCSIWHEGTNVEAGGCADGKCGPYWTQCLTYSGDNCTEVCAEFDRTCVAQGCAGLTAALYEVGLEGGCQIGLTPFREMKGSCDEMIPWGTSIEGTIQAMCCCE